MWTGPVQVMPLTKVAKQGFASLAPQAGSEYGKKIMVLSQVKEIKIECLECFDLKMPLKRSQWVGCRILQVTWRQNGCLPRGKETYLRLSETLN